MPGSDRGGSLRGRKMPAVYGDERKVMGLGPPAVQAVRGRCYLGPILRGVSVDWRQKWRALSALGESQLLVVMEARLGAVFA